MSKVTAPLILEGNRPFVDLTLRGPNGRDRVARFWVDTGGGSLLLTESLTKGLGLQEGERFKGEGKTFAQTSKPDVFLEGFPLDLSIARALIAIDSSNLLPAVAPGRADGLLPGTVLSRYVVTFDYPGGRLTVAKNDESSPETFRMRMPVHETSGFPRTELEIDGEQHGFLLDTGASFTMVSDAWLKKWGREHPDWRREDGPIGEAKMLGGQAIETIVIPAVRWGPITLADVGAVSQREGTFERYMSSMMKGDIIGALGGNVLKDFRLELDYAREVLSVAHS